MTASAVMGVVLLAWMQLFGGLHKVLVFSVGVALGVMTYGGMLWLQKVPEAGAIIRRIKGKLAEKG